MRKIVVLLLMLLAGCGGVVMNDQKPVVTVSIAPLEWLVERVADTTVAVQVLVPETTSPETYEPTARQVGDLSRSDVYFAVGLIDFEGVLGEKIKSVAAGTEYIELSDGLPLLEGTCGHSHSQRGHTHAVDPHVWLSPRYMKVMAARVASVLSKRYPENKEVYDKNLRVLEADIDSLDVSITEKFAGVVNREFAIVHPSLTYFARDYGLGQCALEADGKEPSTGQLRDIVDRLRRANVKRILYSRQSPDAAARAVASELGIDVVEYDPLSRDWERNMKYLTGLICD